MADDFFTFKQFRVLHRKSIMKVGTDGVILGAYADCSNARRILDIGTGTGLLYLMLAQKCNAIIHGIDINEEAVAIARFNAAQSPWANRIEIFHSSVQDFSPDTKYDLIVSNPPFYTTDTIAPEKGRAIARHDINLNISELSASVDRLLSGDGHCYIIYPTEQCKQFEDKVTEFGMFVSRRLYVSSSPKVEPIRTIVEICRKQSEIQEDSLFIENGVRHDYSEKYRQLTRDFYLKF